MSNWNDLLTVTALAPNAKSSVNVPKYYWTVPTITKTCLNNFDSLKPNFYIVKMGFTGNTLFFLFLLKHIDCGYSLEPPRRVPTIYVLSKNMKKYQSFLSEIFQFLLVKFSIYLTRCVSVMLRVSSHCSALERATGPSWGQHEVALISSLSLKQMKMSRKTVNKWTPLLWRRRNLSANHYSNTPTTYVTTIIFIFSDN